MEKAAGAHARSTGRVLVGWLEDGAADDLPGGWRLVQKALLLVLVVMLTHNTIGFAANPDFGTGSAATSEEVLFVEFNGWHALAGYLLAVPALLAVAHARWSLAMSAYLAVAVAGSGVWILLDRDAAGFVPFGDGAVADAIYHFALGAVFGVVALLGARELRDAAAHRRRAGSR